MNKRHIIYFLIILIIVVYHYFQNQRNKDIKLLVEKKWKSVKWIQKGLKLVYNLIKTNNKVLTAGTLLVAVRNKTNTIWWW